MNKDFNKMAFVTKAIHVGNKPDPVTGAVTPAIYQTSTYAQSSPGVHRGYEYTRSHNPTRTRLEECLASLENAKYCTVTATGMSATHLVLQIIPRASTVICGDDVYGGTYRLFTTVNQNDYNFIFTDTTDTKKTIELIKEKKPALLWIESPTNPTLKISDINALTTASREVGGISVVDNTFMSPFFQNPLDLGADIAYHSMSKYINGHSDVVAGALMTNDDKIEEGIKFYQNSIGPSQSPFDSWLVLRGVKTLGVRMERHEQNAREIATLLESHELVEKVVYPGLVSHPQHEIAKKQMSGFGGMIIFYIKGELENSRIFLENLKIFILAESLGGVESLIEHPAIMTHASIPKEKREKVGLSDNLIRLSVGIEDITDLKNDILTAFKACKK